MQETKQIRAQSDTRIRTLFIYKTVYIWKADSLLRKAPTLNRHQL